MLHSPFRLCLLLTRSLCRIDPLETMRQAIAAGADLIQVREKQMSAMELHDWSAQVLQLGRELGVPVLINDSVEIAHALDADGVHLGQDDLSPVQARKILGAGKLIGLSTHDVDQVEAAFALPVDYLGFGPIFPTTTKGYAEGVGPDRLVTALAFTQHPLLAIGGITGDNAWNIPQAAGVAACSAICSTEEIADNCLSLGRFDLY
ncbi:MAG: thiamine phosphate synthase [Planctomycetota bacterium]|jgi:thiamine-phosphate pyrophosphorylase